MKALLCSPLDPLQGLCLSVRNYTALDKLTCNTYHLLSQSLYNFTEQTGYSSNAYTRGSQ
jgi:hypothetical protein